MSVRLTVLAIAFGAAWPQMVSASDASDVEVITVTASKMEENVLDIPVSVQVVSGEELEQKAIYSLEPFLKQLPNVAVSNNYGIFSSPNYRGLATSAFAQESPITVFIDGVPHSSVYGMNLGLLDVDQIEFLRGTQSTLYGQSSLGGVINIKTKQPSGYPEGRVIAEFSENDGQMYFGSYRQDLIEDVLSFGIAARYRGSEGYLENEFPTSKRNYDEVQVGQWNGNVRWNISPQTHVIISFNHEDSDNGGLPFYAENDGSFKTSQEVDAFNRVQVSDQSLKLEHEADAVTVTYLAANQATSAQHESDMDRTFGSSSPLLGDFNGAKFFDDSEVSSMTHELRLSSRYSDFKWVTGIYYQDSLYDAKDNGNYVPNSLFGPMEAHNSSDVAAEQYAVFGQVRIPVTEKFETTLGLRWQRDDKEFDSVNRSVMFGSETVMTFSQQADWDVWLPKIAFGYKTDAGSLIYASVSKGYQAGGFNFTAMDPLTSMYEPQKTIDYELGFKTVWLDNAISFDLNLFYLDITDAHGRSIDALNQITFFNVDKATSFGAEADVSWQLAERWWLSSSLGFNKAEYKSGEFNGSQMANSPEFTSATTLAYGDFAGLYGQLSYTYRSATYTDADNTLEIDGYGLWDGQLGYRIDDYSFYFFAQNLADQEYQTNYYALPFPGPAPISGIGQPRTFGLGVSAEF
ncbi:TonB-dependent receptor [Vibrio sp. LaRot3]|uniref:TonB-dependent receptor n=1 Tax=Vibrio sp. LaRot3 TaxID=2998829 RepID=UPI0022CDC271|nr:TonB-dependent receptor [Vibrio sp. LaRot3]MDA0149567.1 TonB-dependent receptor [Vibrio sp. LaRot3]